MNELLRISHSLLRNQRHKATIAFSQYNRVLQKFVRSHLAHLSVHLYIFRVRYVTCIFISFINIYVLYEKFVISPSDAVDLESPPHSPQEPFRKK